MSTPRVRRGVRLPRSATVQLAVAAAGLTAGGVCRLVTLGGSANELWAITAAAALVPATISMARDLRLYAVLSLHRAGEEERLSGVVGARDQPPLRKTG
jgi:hypothetical protein